MHCECGCGQLAPIAVMTNRKFGWIAGQPKRFVHGHNGSRLKHGLAKIGQRSPEYNSWRGAKARCQNPNNNRYHLYGGRGIQFLIGTVEQLIAEIGFRPKGKTLDRIDPDGNYESGNIRWATPFEQQHNKSKQMKNLTVMENPPTVKESTYGV